MGDYMQMGKTSDEILATMSIMQIMQDLLMYIQMQKTEKAKMERRKELADAAAKKSRLKGRRK